MRDLKCSATLKIEYAEGVAQADAARAYLTLLADERTRPFLSIASLRHVVLIHKGIHLFLRIRSTDQWFEDLKKKQLVNWMLEMSSMVQQVTGGDNEARLKEVVSRWLHWSPGRGSFIIDHLDAPPPLLSIKKPSLSVSVIDARLSSIVTRELYFAAMEEGNFGLALAGKGSYLVTPSRAA